MTTIKGRVAERLVGAGSKSERKAVVLEHDGGHVTLRRIGGNAFRDEHLVALVGKEVKCVGEMVAGNVLVCRDITEE